MKDLPLLEDSKNVLVAPLSWGLGHATRCIPVIQHLLNHGKTVSMASDGPALQVLKNEFPYLESHTLPSYNISYPFASMALNMLLQFPKILKAIQSEYSAIKQLVQRSDIDTIISDNRYGIRHAKCKNIILCHQINIRHDNTIAASLATKMNKRWINKFDQCWIPDFPPPDSIAGELSLNSDIVNSKYVGPLSRLVRLEGNLKRKYLVVLSGPEPSRTRLENELLAGLKGKDFLLVRGLPDIEEVQHENAVNFLNSDQLSEAISTSETIICRSGYSRIMDLLQLNKEAIIIPTPGQTEQEFLARHLDGKHGFTSLMEDKIVNFEF